MGLHVDLGEWVQRDGAWMAVYEVVPLEGDPRPWRRRCEASSRAFASSPAASPPIWTPTSTFTAGSPLTEVFQRLAIGSSAFPLRHHLGGVAYCGDLYGHDEHG